MLTALLALVPLVDEPASLGRLQVTAGRVAQSTVDVSGGVTVITRDEIDREIPQIAVDALRGKPGVFVQQTTPGQGIPIVRGLKGSEVLHLVDGIRLNNAFFRNAPNQYIALVDAASIDHVEVLRGPASTLYGADAMGGVVQFLTRQASYGSAGGSLRLFGGSADDSIGAVASIDRGGERAAWRVQASWLDVGDRETGSGDELPSSYESRAVQASVRWRGGQGEWIADVQHLEQPSTPRVDELVPGFGQDEAESAEFFFEPNERSFAHLRYLGDLDWAMADQVEWHVAWQRLVDDRRTRGAGSTRRRLEDNTSDQFGVTAQFALDQGARQLVYGAEIYQDTVDSARIQQDLETRRSETITSRFPDGSEQTSLAAYLRHEWIASWGTINAGARYSRFDVDIAEADRDAGAELDLDEWTFNLGANWQLTTNLHLVANVGQGFRAPNIFDLATLGERPGNRFNVANPDLGPERLDSLDLGLKWASAAVEAELFGFVANFEDKIDSVPTGELTDEGRVIVRNENLNEVDLYGVEAGVRAELSADDQLWLVVNWTRGTEKQADGTEAPADRVPPLSGEAGWRHQWSPAVQLDAFTRFAAEQDRLSDRDVSDPRINPDGTPGWGTLNARAIWDVTPELRLTAALENLGDKTYREHGSGVDGPGRNLKLSLDWRF